MEEAEFGMDTFREMREKYELPLPIITYNEPDLIVTFPRSAKAVRDLGNTDVLSELNDEEIAGLDFVKTQLTVSKKDYANHFNYSDKKAQRHLLNFKELGLVRLEGKGPSSVYKYIGNEK